MDSIFRSARLKLTLFYLLILLAMSLTLTISFRILAEHEYAKSNSSQYGQVRHVLVAYPWDYTDPDAPPVRPEIAYQRIQNNEEAATRERLNRDFLLINVAALFFGGIVSYWFAGRTLKPIEEAHASQARFAADASHELRTPLASMRVENEVFLRQQHFTEPEAREQIESNLEEVQRLEKLATGLLALSQFDATSLELKPIEVKELIGEAFEHNNHAAKSKHIKLTHELKDAAQILVHHDSALQLLNIVLENAIKYSPEHKKVTVAGYTQANRYVVTVSDEGGGIAEEDLPHIFERLYRGDKARTTKEGGYGLGLALAEQIAQANNANVFAENIGQGARFTIEFDLARQR